MTFTLRPAIRIQTPMIIGLAGASKSGKTYSALRLAIGMAQGGKITMINTEGPRGHQYADLFKYDACDFTEPFSMKRYEEAIKFVAESNPTVVIIDSMSHGHEGIGGMLDQHEKEIDRMLRDEKNDYKKREKMTWAAWVKPKGDEASMINTMLQQKFHIVLCFRGKEKLKIIRGKEPVNMGWRPIASDRIHFETAVTLILPPNSKGIPDLTVDGSELRSPFDTMITDEQINEKLGKKLAEWAKGGAAPESAKLSADKKAVEGFNPEPLPVDTYKNKPPIIPATPEQLTQIQAIFKAKGYTKMSEGLPDLSGFCQREIGSSKELTSQEADDFIKANQGE